jgi:hypothetical protein
VLAPDRTHHVVGVMVQGSSHQLLIWFDRACLRCWQYLHALLFFNVSVSYTYMVVVLLLPVLQLTLLLCCYMGILSYFRPCTGTLPSMDCVTNLSA